MKGDAGRKGVGTVRKMADLMPGENFLFDDSKKATNNLLCHYHKRHYVLDADASPDYNPYMCLQTIPHEPMPDTLARFGAGAKHVIDVLEDVAGDVPKELLADLARQKNLGRRQRHSVLHILPRSRSMCRFSLPPSQCPKHCVQAYRIRG